MADDDLKPIRRGEVRLVWWIVGATVAVCVTVLGAYYVSRADIGSLRADVARLQTDVKDIQTTLSDRDSRLRAIETSLARIEGKLGAKDK